MLAYPSEGIRPAQPLSKSMLAYHLSRWSTMTYLIAPAMFHAPLTAAARVRFQLVSLVSDGDNYAPNPRRQPP